MKPTDLEGRRVTRVVMTSYDTERDEVVDTIDRIEFDDGSRLAFQVVEGDGDGYGYGIRPRVYSIAPASTPSRRRTSERRANFAAAGGRGGR